MNKILETNVVIDYLRNKNKKIVDKIENSIIQEGIRYLITHITLCELWYGVFNLTSKEKQISETKKLNNFVSKLDEIKSLSAESCKIYGELYAELEKKGMRVPQFDLLNASIAIANKIKLITRDKGHFPRINELSEFEFLELWEL